MRKYRQIKVLLLGLSPSFASPDGCCLTCQTLWNGTLRTGTLYTNAPVQRPDAKLEPGTKAFHDFFCKRLWQLRGNDKGPPISKEKRFAVSLFLHPGRLTWNLRIHPWKRRNIFQTIIFRFKLLIFWGVEKQFDTVRRKVMDTFPHWKLKFQGSTPQLFQPMFFLDNQKYQTYMLKKIPPTALSAPNAKPSE